MILLLTALFAPVPELLVAVIVNVYDTCAVKPVTEIVPDPV